MRATPASIAPVQDQRLYVDWYFLLKASPYVSAALIRLGLSANATTVLWGCLNIATTILVYLAIRGHILLVPVIVVAFAVSEILDTSDGEIARYSGTSSPIGGKLLDGIAHKATEFSLAAGYAWGAAAITQSPLAFPIGIALMAGEGMLAYCYERRLLVIRVHLQSAEKAGGSRQVGGKYAPGARWFDLPFRHKVRTMTGLLSYRSVYAAILVAWLSPTLFLWALAALAVYKHASWVRLVTLTLRTTSRTTTA